MRRILAVFAKEIRLLVRDRLFLALQLVVPGIAVMVFGALFTVSLRQVTVAVVDRDGSAAARAAVRGAGSARAALDDGEDMAVVQLRRGIGGRRNAGAGDLQVLLDGTDTYWATSRTERDGEGGWSRMPAASWRG